MELWTHCQNMLAWYAALQILQTRWAQIRAVGVVMPSGDGYQNVDLSSLQSVKQIYSSTAARFEAIALKHLCDYNSEWPGWTQDPSGKGNTSQGTKPTRLTIL
jgi:hypothetical protein